MRRNRTLLGILTSVVMCASLLPVSAVAAGEIYTENKTGSQDGYDFELWKDSGNTTMTLLGNGAFSCEWSNINNCLFRTGKKFDCTQTYQQIGNIYMEYDCDYQPDGNSYLCCYGWTKEPLIEYYIVEDWGSWRPPGADSMGQVTVDGATYDVYRTLRENKPSIIGDTTFYQYWSVRVPSDKQSSGTMCVTDHFKAWESMGLELGKLYEVALNVEGYQSAGKATVNKNVITITDDERETVATEAPTEPADGYYFQTGFEGTAGQWDARGSAVITLSDTACAGSQSLAVTNRADTWNGAALGLSTKDFVPGTAYSFSVMAMQNTAASDSFKLSLQYTDASGKEQYDTVAKADGTKGEWVQLANTAYTIPAGASNLLLYVETAESTNDFFIDDAAGAVKGTQIAASKAGSSQSRSLVDLIRLQKHLLGLKTDITAETGDINNDGEVDVYDLAILKRELLNPTPVVVTPDPDPTESATESLRKEGCWYNTADVSWIDPSKPMVAFAFDDGPIAGGDNSFAGRIQTALHENNSHATFFYVGQNIAGNEAEIKRAQSFGFEIANHTWTHADLRNLSADGIRNEISQCANALTAITGQTDFLLRPPFLGVNETVQQTVATPLINCGFDSGDWDKATTQDMIAKFTQAAQNGSLNGKVILMHETYDSTAQAVEYLVPYLKSQGYQIVSVSEMFKAKGVDMRNGVVYNQLP